jgi:hypothetical protein
MASQSRPSGSTRHGRDRRAHGHSRDPERRTAWTAAGASSTDPSASSSGLPGCDGRRRSRGGSGPSPADRRLQGVCRGSWMGSRAAAVSSSAPKAQVTASIGTLMLVRRREFAPSRTTVDLRSHGPVAQRPGCSSPPVSESWAGVGPARAREEPDHAAVIEPTGEHAHRRPGVVPGRSAGRVLVDDLEPHYAADDSCQEKHLDH